MKNLDEEIMFKLKNLPPKELTKYIESERIRSHLGSNFPLALHVYSHLPESLSGVSREQVSRSHDIHPDDLSYRVSYA